MHTWGSHEDIVVAIAALGSLAVVVLAGLVVARSVSRPVGQLLGATCAVGEGDPFRGVNITSMLEFGLPGASFKQRVTELEAANKELVELVEQRTQESAATEERAARALEELKLAQDRLIHAEKISVVGQLVAGVAHELINPLTSVAGFSELLLREGLGPDAKRSAQRISDEARRAATIAQNLLSFARKQEVRSARVDVNEALTATLDLKGYDLRASNIDVESELTQDLPAIMADINQLQSVLLNLISNAQYAMTDAHDGGTLRVRTEELNGSIRIAVADDGSGIPAEDLTKVFDPFFTTKPVGTGTGLGLSICHGIVAELGGSIWVESDYQYGTTFYVEFPVAPDSTEGEGDRPIEPAELASVALGRRVLVIDDDNAIRELVAATLSRAGHHVVGQSDARAALGLTKRANFDIVLVDIKMPGMSVQEFYRELLQKAPDMLSRLVFMTGDTASKRTQEFLEWAERPVIEKPFTIETLRRVIAHESGSQASSVRSVSTRLARVSSPL